MRKCRFCAEDIQDAAIVCKHCGRDLIPGRPTVAAPPAAVLVAPPVLKVRQADWISTTAKWGVGLFFVLIGVGWCSALTRTGGPINESRSIATQPTGVTLAQFAQLRDGLSYADAVRVLGSPGTQQSRSALGGTVTVMYAWPGSGSIGANMNAMFQDDRLVTKAQFGLR